MNKIACFDLDGVSLKEHKPFSKRLIEKQGEEIRPVVEDFFENHFDDVMIGQAGLAESLQPYLENFSWSGDADSLLALWFEEERSPNNDVLGIVQGVKDLGVPTYLVTDNPKERIEAYWEEFLDKYFNGRFVSGETGLKKSSKELWLLIASDTDTRFENIFFVDDDIKKVEIARSTGVNAVLYSDSSTLKQQLNDFL